MRKVGKENVDYDGLYKAAKEEMKSMTQITQKPFVSQVRYTLYPKKLK